MSDIAGLTDGSRTPGVYRILGDPIRIDSALSRAGWATAVLPAVETTHDFYAQIAGVLQFGDYFGRNLDALWDCLTDLEEPTALILSDWTRLARARPRKWAAILDVLAERCALPPAFAVVLA